MKRIFYKYRIYPLQVYRNNRAGIAQIYACGDTAVGGQSLDWSRYVSMKQEALAPNGDGSPVPLGAG